MCATTERSSTSHGSHREYQLGVAYRKLPLDDANVVEEGLAVDVITFDDVVPPTIATVSPHASHSKVFEQKDDEEYTKVCYEAAITLPLGLEYTVPAPDTSSTRYNSLVGGCTGYCDGASWYFGIDKGFAALAGVAFEPSQNCAPKMIPVERQDLISEKLVQHCGSRCAQALYDTSTATASRNEAPGMRTLVTTMSNWSAWVSCSIYDGLTKWSAQKGPDYVFADTLGTSKIHFVDAELSHVGRPHSSAILHKKSGWETHGTERWIGTCERYGLRGLYEQPNIGVATLLFGVGNYGRSKLAWSVMAVDTLFYIDYNLLAKASPCSRWWNFVRKYMEKAKSFPNTYLGCYTAGAALTYGALQVKQRREQEARAQRVAVRRGGILWEDKGLWTSYMSTDVVVNHSALVVGGCADDWANSAISRIMNDIVDLGYDWAVGDVGNGILTLANGKTGRSDLAGAYRKFASVLNRMGTVQHDTVGASFMVTTHAWQMSDTRHKVLGCALTSDDVGIGPTTTSASWHQAVILNEAGMKIEHEFETAFLNGNQVCLTKRSWQAIAKNPIVGTLLYYGYCWVVQKRDEKQVPSVEEIEEVEDILRCVCVEAAMELEYKDFMEAMWCWVIESFCASDLMWHAMIGSTAIAADRRMGEDRWDDTKEMPQWEDA